MSRLAPLFPFTLVVSVAACGGSGGGDPVATAPASPRTLSNAGLTLDLARDPDTGIITLDPLPTEPGGDLALLPLQSSDVPGFETLATADESARGLRRATDDGVVAIFLTDPDLAEPFAGTIAGRVTDADIPIEGSGRYSGPYAGFLDSTELGSFGDTVTGRVQLDVDFENGVFTGIIEDRETTQGSALADLNVQEGIPINVGDFSGFVFSETDVPVPAVGTTNIAVVGNGGTDVVGTTTVQHSFPSDHPLGDVDIREYGGFLAGSDD